MLTDVIIAASVALNQHVVYLVAYFGIYLCPDSFNGWCERYTEKRLVAGVSVDGLCAIFQKFALHGDEAWDLTALMHHLLEVDFRA